MAKTSKSGEIGLSVEQAINRVLVAEREAEQFIRQCNLQSQQTLELARHRANTIMSRANSRINWVHQRCRRAVNDAKVQIKQQKEKQKESDLFIAEDGAMQTPSEQEMLEKIAREIARFLCTADAGWKQ